MNDADTAAPSDEERIENEHDRLEDKLASIEAGRPALEYPMIRLEWSLTALDEQFNRAKRRGSPTPFLDAARWWAKNAYSALADVIAAIDEAVELSESLDDEPTDGPAPSDGGDAAIAAPDQDGLMACFRDGFSADCDGDKDIDARLHNLQTLADQKYDREAAAWLAGRYSALAGLSGHWR